MTRSYLKSKEKIKLTKELFRKRIIKAVVISVSVICGAFLAVSYLALPLYLNQHVNYRGYATEKYPMQDIYVASDYGLSENQMYLTAEDGFKIWTSEIYRSKPKGVIIYLSGINQPSVTYFYGHSKFMKENGYATILLETRGHGRSDGNRICLGFEEDKDVRAVVNYIKKEEKYKNVPIIIQGVSMGGAAAVNAFGQIDEIDALIAMSAYSGFEDVILDIMGNYGIPKFIRQLEKPILQSSLKILFGKDKVINVKPLEQIKNAKERPILLIASKYDTGVPYANTLRLKEANTDAEVWIRNSKDHFIMKNSDFKNMEDDKEYCNKILEFLEGVKYKGLQ